MKILVTGASGFIGGRFARFALEQGLDVRVNGRRAESVEHLVRRGAEFVPGDLSDPELARELCRDVEAVVHCAGAVGVWGRYQDFHQGNVQVTENVVEACLKQRVRRLVHLSSPSIYFDGRDHLGLTEEQVPKRFRHPYAATKYLAEQKVFGAQEFGLETLALRPRFVTGAGDMSIFPRLLKMQRKGRLAIVGNGLNKVDFTSVQNLNEAMLSSLLAAGSALRPSSRARARAESSGRCAGLGSGAGAGATGGLASGLGAAAATVGAAGAGLAADGRALCTNSSPSVSPLVAALRGADARCAAGAATWGTAGVAGLATGASATGAGTTSGATLLRSGISMGISTGTGRGWVSNSSGNPTTPSSTNTAAPIRRCRARRRITSMLSACDERESLTGFSACCSL